MARDRDRDPGDIVSPSTIQSKRSSLVHDSDSLDSDNTQHGQAPNSQHQTQPSHQQRKHQKHHVAGGGTRLHARTASSKGLYKNNAATSSTKLRRLTSPGPDPDRNTTAATALTPSSSSQTHHRRNPSSEARLSRDSSATNLKKNSSATNLKKNHSQTSLQLKRNKSHVEVNKRTKSAAQLRRSTSEKAVHKLKPSHHHKSAVHFALGGTDGQGQNDGDGDGDGDGDADEADEWVDASSSASPYLSRRGSVQANGQSSAHAQESPRRGVAGQRDGADLYAEEDGDEGEPTPLADPNRLLFDDATQHSRTLTSRLLQRNPSHATISMSSTTAMAKAASPDSRHSASTLSVTPALPQGMAGSNGTVEVTSRFITSQDSPGSFYTPADGNMADKRPHSMGGLPGLTNAGLSTASTKAVDDEDDDDDDDDLTDEEDTGITSAIASTARSGDVGGGLPRATSTLAVSDKSRTQQKINLQRASSSMEPVRHRHSNIGGFAAEVAEVAGPLLGGAGYDTQDPRVNRLLERTGVEYNIVRRYQNPVARSLGRLALLPGNDKARRIPRGGAAHPSSRHSVHNFGGGLSQSFRETTTNGNGNGNGTAQQQGQGARRPEAIRRAYSSIRHSSGAAALGSSLDTDTDDAGAGKLMAAGREERERERLSGASLVNGEEDEGIQAILRSLWDKNLADLAASAD